MDERKETPAPDLSQMLSQIMANPKAVSMLSGLLGGTSLHAPGSEAEHPVPRPPVSPRDEDRRRLLLALKPYVNKERRHAIDKILMITDALALLQRKGGG